MKGKGNWDGGIARGLEDGWDYRPDWRLRLVKRMRAQHRDYCEVIFTERDPFVRQLFRLFVKGECAATDAFQWAVRCHSTRKSSLAAGILNAMTVTDFSTAQIAERLNTFPFAITVYQKLFFDVARYRGNRAWLGMIVLPDNPSTTDNPFMLKSRLLMAAAFHGGAKRLTQVMTGRMPNDAEVAKLRGEIGAALAARAHQFIIGGGHPDAGDFTNFLEILRLPRDEDVNSKREKAKDEFIQFIRAFNGQHPAQRRHVQETPPPDDEKQKCFSNS
jgi:hypothetical protein